jgi:predicted AAA+ superfamily ATPase
VVQLQTAFGGGKTHTMLAVYHLAKRKVPLSRLQGIPTLMDEMGISDVPEANIAVIDGIKIGPSQLRSYANLEVRTLWGDLAYQLWGKEGYAMVAASDAAGTSPGKGILVELLSKAAPCVILMDELVGFIRQLDNKKEYLAGSFDSNLSFIQALTEAAKLVPNAMVLASLPESDVEVGGSQGTRALNALEKYFARVESIWKPVAAEEAFEIVRRRLFESAGEEALIEEVCRAFNDFYRHNSHKFPAETQESYYLERLRRSYPIHPEIFDRLYEDWSTLEKFQRTRGVLQLMATVIYQLWRSDESGPMIMPGVLPLADNTVRDKSIHYLPQGWEPVIDKDVDGIRSAPSRIDHGDTRIGAIKSASRVARTIFLGSAPSSNRALARGIEQERILLGAALPGHSLGLYEDAIKRLRDRCHHLYSEKQRFWFDTKPNLRREMESRKESFGPSEIERYLKDELARLLAKHTAFCGTHIFPSSNEVPDNLDDGIRLVILKPDDWLNKDTSEIKNPTASHIQNYRGEKPRLRRNRLVFLVPDADSARPLKDQAKVCLAWQSVIDDIHKEVLNHDRVSLRQANNQLEAASKLLIQRLLDCYKWLLGPFEEKIGDSFEFCWEAIPIASTGTKKMPETIYERMLEEEWLIEKWSPIHLHTMLDKYYFGKAGQEDVHMEKLWQDCGSYLYLPRLLNRDVLLQAIQKGVNPNNQEPFYAIAQGKEGNSYLGFAFGDSLQPSFDDQTLVINKTVATAYKQELQERKLQQDQQPSIDQEVQSVDQTKSDSGPTFDFPPKADQSEANEFKDRYFGTVAIDVNRWKLQIADIHDEIIKHFRDRPGVAVDIKLEIECISESQTGFDETLQRIISENAEHLKFLNSEFDEK